MIVTLTTTLVLATVLGLIPAAITHKKGRNFAAWWVFGALLFIVALPLAIVATPQEDVLAKRYDLRKCPFCAEYVRSQATACRHCGRDLPSTAELSDRRAKARAKLAASAERGELTIDGWHLTEQKLWSTDEQGRAFLRTMKVWFCDVHGRFDCTSCPLPLGLAHPSDLPLLE